MNTVVLVLLMCMFPEFPGVWFTAHPKDVKNPTFLIKETEARALVEHAQRVNPKIVCRIDEMARFTK